MKTVCDTFEDLLRRGYLAREEEKHRRIECNKYPECLDRAAKVNNLRFTCKGCESYAWNDPMDKEERVMKEEAVVIEDQKKFCTRCKISKPLEAFNRGLGKHGKRSWCRACDAEYSLDYQKRKAAGKVKARKRAVVQYQSAVKNSVEEQAGNSNVKPDRATELAEAHWEYVGKLLEMHGHEDLAEIAFHYKSAMIHGYKHGVADVVKGVVGSKQ